MSLATAVYGLLDPIADGLFVAALIFDAVYARTGEIQWDKGAAWLLVFGLLVAIPPRLINLFQVWITGSARATTADRIDFVLNVLAIVAAIVNAFVHSRDGYDMVPAGVWLSACTVVLLTVGNIVLARQRYATP